MSNFLGRGVNAGPATEFFPLSQTVASSPAILVTATTATTGGTTLHTADLNAQDVLFVRLSNVSGSSVTAFVNLGSLATTGTVPVTVNNNSQTTVFSGDCAISKSGVVSAWSTATQGLYAYGYVARTYTATS